MDKIWLASYPKGVPAEIGPGPCESLGELFQDVCRRFPDRVAYINMGATLRYRELARLAEAFGSYLQSRGLPRGARVALMMPNCLQYPVCMFGALAAGYVVVNCNPLYTRRELAHQLSDSGAEALVVVENFAHVVEQALPDVRLQHVLVTGLGDLMAWPKGWLTNLVVRRVRKMVPAWRIPQAVALGRALAQGRRRPAAAVPVGRNDLAFLQYTGGTTGVAKGAMLTHGNLLANVEQAHAWIAPFLGAGPELIITALPLYHVFALTANCFTYLKLGATNVLITNPRDIPALVAELAKYRFTAITGVNTLFNALVHHPDFARVDFSALTVTLGGGMAVQEAVAQRWQALTGKTLIEAYGLTETSPAVCINPLDLAAYNGKIGLPISSTEISIRDEEGRELGVGVAGELCVRGPQVMAGYYQRPADTAAVMTPDGFLRTGDMAEVDERGYVRLVDRKKDMITVSGFKVYPNEVENVVASCAGVLEVAAIGVPDEKSGEAVMLFVVRKDESLSAAAILDYCRENLTAYKVPKHIEFRSELPKTNVGKILRRALRDEVLRQAA